MDTDLHRDERDESWELGGAYRAPSSKVRLPEHVTKLRKSHRTDQGSASGDGTHEKYA